ELPKFRQGGCPSADLFHRDLHRIELRAERAVDHARAELDDETPDDRRLDLHFHLDMLLGYGRQRILDGGKMRLARLLGESYFGGNLTLVLGDQRAVGAPHVERREKSPVGSKQFEDVGSEPIDASSVKHARERACLLLGGEYGAPQQASQIGDLIHKGFKTIEI